MRRNGIIIEINYNFKYIDPKGNIETIKEATDYDNIKEVEFIFNKLTDINSADFAMLPKEMRQAHMNKLITFRDRINKLISDKVTAFNDIHINMG